MSKHEFEVFERARAGDLDAFAELVRLFERRVRAVLGRILDDERDVDEAAQDTFVQAWRHLDRFRGGSAPFTWLYRIAVNEALQRTRRKRLDTRSLDEAPELEHRAEPSAGARPPPADVEAAGRESLAFLTARVRALPLESRVPLVLRDVEGSRTRRSPRRSSSRFPRSRVASTARASNSGESMRRGWGTPRRDRRRGGVAARSHRRRRSRAGGRTHRTGERAHRSAYVPPRPRERRDEVFGATRARGALAKTTSEGGRSR